MAPLARSFVVFALALGLALPLAASAQDVAAENFTRIVGDDGRGAQGLIFANICDGVNDEVEGDRCHNCQVEGQCTLTDAMQVVVNISSFLLGIIGSLVLLMFVYGGFLWITSYGRPEKVTRGKETMSNAVIGLAIVLGSYVILNFVIATVTGQPLDEDLPAELIEVIPEPVSAPEPVAPPSGQAIPGTGGPTEGQTFSP